MDDSETLTLHEAETLLGIATIMLQDAEFAWCKAYRAYCEAEEAERDSCE